MRLDWLSVMSGMGSIYRDGAVSNSNVFGAPEMGKGTYCLVKVDFMYIISKPGGAIGVLMSV